MTFVTADTNTGVKGHQQEGGAKKTRSFVRMAPLPGILLSRVCFGFQGLQITDYYRAAVDLENSF